MEASITPQVCLHRGEFRRSRTRPPVARRAEIGYRIDAAAPTRIREARNNRGVDATRPRRSSWVYLVVYGVFSAAAVGFALATLGAGRSVVPPWLMMSADYGWFLALGANTYFFPKQGGKIRVSTSLVPDPTSPGPLDLLCCPRRWLPDDAARAKKDVVRKEAVLPA